MFRKTIFERMLEGVSRVALLPTNEAGGTTIVADGGGSGGSSPAQSTPASPSPGGGSDGGPSGSPAPATPADPPSSPSSDPWENLGSDIDDVDEIAIPAAPVEPPAAPVTPAPAPVPPQQPSPQPAPQEPPAQPAAPAQGTPQAANSMPSPAEPAALAAFMLDPANRAQIVEHIARDRYALSDAEVQELTEDAVVAVPKLLARAHLETTASMMRFLEQSIPSFIQRHTRVSDANKQAETKFFSAVKGLDANNSQHVSAAKRIVGIYRQMNPDAKMDDIISICAPMVLHAVGGTAAPAPQGNAPPANAPRPVPAAFQPAIGSNGAPTPPVADSEWAGLGQEFEED